MCVTSQKMYIVMYVLDVRTELFLICASFNPYVVLHLQPDRPFTRDRQLKFNNYRLLRLIYWHVDSTWILVSCKILTQQGKVHDNWVILCMYCVFMNYSQCVCVSRFHRPWVLSLPAGRRHRSAPQLPAVSRPSLQTPQYTARSTLLLHLMICISVYSGSVGCVLRPRPVNGHQWNICTYL